MRVVLQRVKHASVHVDGQETGSIGQGFLILLGVSDTDDESIADKMADKICKSAFLRMRTERRTDRSRMWTARSLL